MIGVLLMAYGSPAGPEDLEAYYTHIRGGRRPSPEMLADLAARYRAIGGRSPLLDVTQRQAEGLQARLDREAPGRYRVYIGMKHSPPFIAEVIAAMAADGLREGVGLALAPHYSRMSIGTYIGTAEAARRRLTPPLAMRYVQRWGEHPRLIDALADRLQAAMATLPDDERTETPVIFTAHSLPEKILAWGDPYPEELRRTAEAVAARAGIRRWVFAYQSAGRSADPWLGPDVAEAIRRLHGSGARSVAVCTVGFIADHLEVLYDLDIEAKGLAGSLGLRFVRAGSLNDHPLLIEALADLVQHHAVEPPADAVAAH